MATNGSNGTKSVWQAVAVRLIVPLVLMGATALVVHEIRLSRIEGNRFTDADAQRLERRILDKLPPDWLIREHRDQEQRIRALEKK